jgi:hypothetical protein
MPTRRRAGLTVAICVAQPLTTHHVVDVALRPVLIFSYATTSAVAK